MSLLAIGTFFSIKDYYLFSLQPIHISRNAPANDICGINSFL